MKKRLRNWLIARLDPNYSIIKASEEYLLKKNQVMSDDLQVLVTKPLSYEAIMVKKKWLWVSFKKELFVQEVLDGSIEIINKK